MRPSRPVAPRAGSAPSPGSSSRRRCGPPQRRDASAVPASQVRVVRAVHLQHRHRRRAGDGRGEPAALGPHLGPDGPAVVLERGVRHAGHLHRPPVALDADGEVVGVHPGRPGPLPHEALDVHALVGPQPPLGPARHLGGEHAAPPAQQGAALPGRVAHHRAPDGEGVRCAEHRERGDEAGVQRGDRPADHAAPAVADDPGRGFAECADQAGDVTGERPQVVAARGLVRVAVAAQVHGDGVEARVREGGQLATPGPPELGEAVQEHDERCTRVAALREVQADAVRGDVTVLPRSGEPDRRGVGGRAGHVAAAPLRGPVSAPTRRSGHPARGARRNGPGAATCRPTRGGSRSSAPACGSCGPSGSRGTRTARHQNHQDEDDGERHPPEEPEGEQLGQGEEEEEEAEQADRAGDGEEHAAGDALADLRGDLGLGELDLGAHEVAQLRGDVGDQRADRFAVRAAAPSRARAGSTGARAGRPPRWGWSGWPPQSSCTKPDVDLDVDRAAIVPRPPPSPPHPDRARPRESARLPARVGSSRPRETRIQAGERRDRLHALIGQFADPDDEAGAGQVLVGIETDRGPWVAALVAAGYRVFAVNPDAGRPVPGAACDLGRQERRRGRACAGRHGPHRRPPAARGGRGHRAGRGGQGAGPGPSEPDLGTAPGTCCGCGRRCASTSPAALDAFAAGTLDLGDRDALELLATGPGPGQRPPACRAEPDHRGAASGRRRRRPRPPGPKTIQAALRARQLRQPRRAGRRLRRRPCRLTVAVLISAERARSPRWRAQVGGPFWPAPGR